MTVRSLLERAQAVLPRSDDGVAVLAYHLIGGGTDAPVDLGVSDFRRQMEVLRSECTVISLKSALSGESRGDADKPAVVLTFDDAYSNFRSVAWPILKDFGFPVTLYVPVAFVNGEASSPIRGKSLPACSWNDLEALAAEGVELGSHTVSHLNLARATTDVIDRELRESRRELERRLGLAVESFCYPQAKWTPHVLRRTREYYDNAVGAGGRRFVFGRHDRHAIPRFPIRRDLGSFETLLRAPIWFSEAIADVVRRHR